MKYMNEKYRRFIGINGKYQIPQYALVELIKTYPKRKCKIKYKGKEYITFVTLLRKLKENELIPNLLHDKPFHIKFI